VHHFVAPHNTYFDNVNAAAKTVRVGRHRSAQVSQHAACAFLRRRSSRVYIDGGCLKAFEHRRPGAPISRPEQREEPPFFLL
jgi:hypothetical protein